jgi:hypothetical protein
LGPRNDPNLRARLGLRTSGVLVLRDGRVARVLGFVPGDELMKICQGCVEKDKRLNEAVRLLRRGVKAMNRVGWEPGEKDSDWKLAARSYVAQYRAETEYMKTESDK